MLYSRLLIAIYFIYNSVYMSIPIFQFITLPPFSPDNHDGMVTHLEPDLGMGSQVGLTKHHDEQS